MYDKKYLTGVLNSHGYNPTNIDGGWLQFAILLLILQKLDKK